MIFYLLLEVDAHMKMDKKEMKMGSGMCCSMCGAPWGQCGCGKGMAVIGLLLVVLGVLLWRGMYFNLERAFAVVLVLMGLKKLVTGLKGHC